MKKYKNSVRSVLIKLFQTPFRNEDRMVAINMLQETTKETWKPKLRQRYFYIDAFMEIGDSEWDGWSSDNGLLDIGNCFRTKEEALAKAEQIKKLLKEL